jgi:hypothetical protein
MKYKSLLNLAFFAFVITVLGCAKTDSSTNVTPVIPVGNQIGANSLIINEIKCRKPDDFTLYGDTTKWIELYNPKDTILTLEKGKWFFTDSLFNQQKFRLDSTLYIKPKGFLVVWFEKQTPTNSSASYTQFIIPGFSISKTAGDFGVYYKQDSSSSLVAINTTTYNYPSDQPKSQSNGRKPDGVGVIQLLDKVTLGTSNN